MTKEDLIFDWKKSESRSRDKIFAVIIVTLIFAIFSGLVDTRLPNFRNTPAQGAGVIRLTSEAIAKSWLLETEENGPFPGRLELNTSEIAAASLDSVEASPWTDYRVDMRPLTNMYLISRAEITPKGKQMFPAARVVVADPAPDISVPGKIRRIPILIPYDRAALAWIPSETGDFILPARAELVPDSLRFTLCLRENGSVAEIISLTGVTDPVQEAMGLWLRGVRFKEGAGERWFGLRVDFKIRRDDVAKPE